MSQQLSLPNYVEFTNILQTVEKTAHASFFHGAICGCICGGLMDVNQQWQMLFKNKKKDPTVIKAIKELYEASIQQLKEFSFDFSLLLPDEETDINTRAEALGLWAQGFLIGLKKAKVPITNRQPGEVTESIHDLVEISKVSFGDIATSEEDETAYTELVEYVRLSIIMIFQDLQSNNTNTIH